MKKDYKVNMRNLPTRMPTFPLITIWLLLDRFGAPAWAHGVYWTLAVLIMIIFGFSLWQETWVDITIALRQMDEADKKKD